MTDEEIEAGDAAADAIRKMRDLAPTALELVREQARTGKTAKDRADAKAYLEARGFTVDGDEPYTFPHDPRVDD